MKLKSPLPKAFGIGLIISIIILWHGPIVFAKLLDVPLGDELYHEVYEFINRIVAKNYVTKINPGIRPYSQDEVAEILIELNKKVKNGDLKLSRIEEQRLRNFLLAFIPPLSLPTVDGGEGGGRQDEYLFQTQSKRHKFGFDFGIGESIISRRQKASDSKTGYATLFRPTASGQIYNNFAFYSDLKVYYLSATQFPDIPKTEVRMSQPGKETKTASLASYYIKTKLPWFELFFGNDNLHWGPGQHGALLISENPLPMYMIKLTAPYYPVKFQFVTAKLGSNIEDNPLPPFDKGDKYLAAHRLELNLWRKLRIGVAESIIFARRFEPIYLNPVQIYTTTEFVLPEAGGKNDNVLISGDIDLTLLKNLEIYGEVLIDDYRPFSYSPKNWGNKFALLFGGYWVDPFSIADTNIRLEYAFVNQYAYTHSHAVNVYTHFNSVIGHQIGTDADNLWLNLKHYFTANLAMLLEYQLERHGEGNVNKPHPQGAPDDDEWEFLSGVTESTHSICLGASYNLIGKYSVAWEYTHSWIKNADNQNGVNDTNNQVLLSGQYRF